MLPSSQRAKEQDEEFARILPAGWIAVGDWHEVNLDADEEDENLLFFRFDGGQVGALILEGDPETSISTPDLLFPRYFDDLGPFGQETLGQGVIAPPNIDDTELMAQQVSDDLPAPELTMLGGKANLTFVWWKGTGQGYGVTQLYAPGGFGIIWEEWLDDPEPITSVVGYFPLEDYRARSNICRLTLYTRRTDLAQESPTIIFRGEPQGIHFCDSVIPAHPYAPEGVVLAYLLSPHSGETTVTNLLTEGTTLAQLDAESSYERFAIERIEDIAGYPAVELDEAATANTLTTSVCVEFAQVSNPVLRRWLLYTLRFQEADVAQDLPRRWTVSSADTQPPPTDPLQEEYCNLILGGNAP